MTLSIEGIPNRKENPTVSESFTPDEQFVLEVFRRSYSLSYISLCTDAIDLSRQLKIRLSEGLKPRGMMKITDNLKERGFLEEHQLDTGGNIPYNRMTERGREAIKKLRKQSVFLVAEIAVNLTAPRAS